MRGGWVLAHPATPKSVRLSYPAVVSGLLGPAHLTGMTMLSVQHRRLAVGPTSGHEPGQQPKNVFVFSGGGSRGAAQVGMLRALLGNGVMPDALVGGSVGALNASYLAVEPSMGRVDALAEEWARIGASDFTGSRRDAALNVARRRPYLWNGSRLRALIARWAPVGKIEDLALPLRIATTDLHTGRAVHHDTGPLVETLAASTCLPGVFPPVRLPHSGARHDGSPHTHSDQIDAGVAENLPASGARDLVEAGDTVWLLDVTRSACPRVLTSPIDALVAALLGSVRNQPVATFDPGVQVVRLRIPDEFDAGQVFDFTHVRALFKLGERSAETAVDVLAHRGPRSALPPASSPRWRGFGSPHTVTT